MPRAAPSLGSALELDARWNDGISVLLLWQPPAETLIVAVCDAKTGDRFELEVQPGIALDAFRHPYAYHARASEANQG
jgi:hypothetical protein